MQEKLEKTISELICTRLYMMVQLDVHIVNLIFSLFLVHENLICGNLTVTGDDNDSCTGTYIISQEKASKSPNQPVYKLKGQDRFIYYHPDGAGWRIGRKEHLRAYELGPLIYLDTDGWHIGPKENLEGSHYYKSKLYPILIQMCLHD